MTVSFTKDRSIYVAKRAQKYHELFTPLGLTLVGNSAKLTRTRTGVSNPKYKEQIAKQENATTPMTGTFDSYELSRPVLWQSFFNDVNFPSDKRIYRNTFYGDICSNATATDNWPGFTLTSAKSYNRALTEYLKKVRAVQVQFSAPTFLGELGEAIHMIRHPAQGLSNLAKSWIDQVKKIKKQRPKDWKKNLSGAWLEQAFGWSPLINDIQSAYKAYKGLANEQKEQPVSAYGIEEKLIPSSCEYDTFHTVDSSSCVPRTTKIVKEMHVTKIKGMVSRRVEATVPAKLEPFGFDPWEFFPTAWELLPWSFLVDYFSNIGDVITASCASRASIRWTNVTYIKLQQIRVMCAYDKSEAAIHASGYLTGDGFAQSSKSVRRSVDRQWNFPIGYPDIALELPGQPAQWANMLALAVQVNLGLHPQRYVKRYG